MNRPPSFLRLAFRQFWVLFGGIFFLAGGVFLAVGVGFLLSEYHYAAHSVTTDGVVLEKYSSMRSNGGSSDYHLRYGFKTPQGQAFESDSLVSWSTHENAKVGDRVRIQYLPEDPQANRVATAPDYLFTGMFAGIGFVSTAIGAPLLVMGLNRARRQLRVYQHGVCTEGTVTRVAETNLSVNNVVQWAVWYSYRDHVGQTHEAESDSMAPDKAQQWKPGDTGTVLYDPRRPDSSVWLGREGPHSL